RIDGIDGVASPLLRDRFRELSVLAGNDGKEANAAQLDRRARQDAEAPMDRWAAALAAGEPVTVAQVVADRLGDEVLDRL
ncbi:protoporphyrinogen oxidase, partial [Enterococcus faecium]